MSAGLTRADRFHLDVYGYVLLENVVTPEETERIKAALYRLKADPDLEAKRVYTRKHADYYQLFGHLVEYDPALLEYAVHPKLIPLVEEVVGGTVRLEESEAIINRRDPSADREALFRRRTNPTGFHTGTRATWGGYYGEDRL